MKRALVRRPSPSMVVAIIALVFAASGTAIAATKLVNGNKLIKKGTLSGNRLEKHTLTGTQINLNELGTVPNAQQAESAVTATNAMNAVNAENATTATSTNDLRTWFQTASAGQTVQLLTIGPFTFTGACTGTSGDPTAQTEVATSESGSVLNSPGGVNEVPFGPSNGAVTIGATASGTSLAWAGPGSGSESMLSGDGDTYVNTFASVGTGINGADCTFVGHAIVVTQ